MPKQFWLCREAHVKSARGIYRQFVELEEKAAWVYLQLASHFSSNTRLSSFWFEMALEEKQHAGLLQFCLCEGLFAEDLPNEAEIDRMKNFFRSLEKRALNPNLTVEEAFSIAIEMENSEINDIYCHLTTALHSSTYLLKRKIATFVPHHIEGLAAAAEKFGASGKIVQQARRLLKNSNPQKR